MEVHDSSIKKLDFLAKNGPKACPRASHAKLSTQKVHIYLTLTTFGGEITFGHITQ